MPSLSAANSRLVLQNQILGLINRTDHDAWLGNERRAERRFLRAVPVVLAPWVDSRPDPDERAFAVTRDMSPCGMGLVLQQPFRAEGIVIGIRRTADRESPHSVQYFIGSITANTPIGGGFWLLNVELSEPVVPDESPEFRRLQESALRLAPPMDATAVCSH